MRADELKSSPTENKCRLIIPDKTSHLILAFACCYMDTVTDMSHFSYHTHPLLSSAAETGCPRHQQDFCHRADDNLNTRQKDTTRMTNSVKITPSVNPLFS